MAREPRFGFRRSSRTTIWPPDPAPTMRTPRRRLRRVARSGRSAIIRLPSRAPPMRKKVSRRSKTTTERGRLLAKGFTRVNAATDVIDATGLAGVFGLMTLESACIPVPSEAIMLFAGFNVSEGNLTLFGVVAAGVLGNLTGSLIAYAAGYYGRIELLDRNRFIHISRRHLEWADRWFERHGSATVFFTRMLPIIRTFISLPAGVARM